MKRRALAVAALTLAVWLPSCGGDDPVAVGPPAGPPDPEPPATPTCTGQYCDSVGIAAIGLDAGFYQKMLIAGDIPVISSEKVDDQALTLAAEVIDTVLSFRPDVREAMVALSARVGIMDISELTTDIPEHAYLINDIVTDWNTRARGLGGTPEVPITTVGEENLLCLDQDLFSGESILIHEFAHAVHLMGIAFVDPTFEDDLQTAFVQAITGGLWAGTYARTNSVEYWAEGVQSWFDANQEPQLGVHNEIDTRAELQDYDPLLYELISRYMPATDWRPTCP